MMRTTISRGVLPLLAAALLFGVQASCGPAANHNANAGKPAGTDGGTAASSDAGTGASTDAGAEADAGEDGGMDAGEDGGAPDAGPSAPTTGHIAFAASLDFTTASAVSASLDGTAVDATLLAAVKAGNSVVFSAGAGQEGLELPPGTHHFEASVTAPVQTCTDASGGPGGGPGGPGSGSPTCTTSDSSLDESLDVDLAAGQDVLVAVMYSVVDDPSGNGTTILVGRITSVDVTPATSGDNATMGRVAILRGPKQNAYEGTYTVGFGDQSGTTIQIPVESDGTLQVPADQAGVLSVTEAEAVYGPQDLSVRLPAVPAGAVLPVVAPSSYDWTVPADQAGPGTQLSPPS